MKSFALCLAILAAAALCDGQSTSYRLHNIEIVTDVPYVAVSGKEVRLDLFLPTAAPVPFPPLSGFTAAAMPPASASGAKPHTSLPKASPAPPSTTAVPSPRCSTPKRRMIAKPRCVGCGPTPCSTTSTPTASPPPAAPWVAISCSCWAPPRAIPNSTARKATPNCPRASRLWPRSSPCPTWSVAASLSRG